MPLTRYQFLLKSIAEDDGSDSCLEWPYGRHSFGYGNCWNGKESILVHVLTYSIVHGASLPLPFVVRHTCDNPPCFRSRHLISGTQADNIRDAIERRRFLCVGSENRQALLSDPQVLEIRRMYATKSFTQTQLASLFGVGRGCIADVVCRRCWTHI